jgi:hypothetical protein
LKNPPVGSILVVDGLSKDQKSRTSIAVMYRVQGSDLEHNDWYWMQFIPKGTIA